LTRRVALSLATSLPLVWTIFFAVRVLNGEHGGLSQSPYLVLDLCTDVFSVLLWLGYLVMIRRDDRLADKRFWILALVFAGPVVEIVYLVKYKWHEINLDTPRP